MIRTLAVLACLLLSFAGASAQEKADRAEGAAAASAAGGEGAGLPSIAEEAAISGDGSGGGDGMENAVDEVMQGETDDDCSVGVDPNECGEDLGE